MKAIIVGRHAPDFGSNPDGVEVVETRNIQFPATAEECLPILRELLREAHEVDGRVLFQNTPAQVTVALYQMGRDQEWASTSGFARPGLSMRLRFGFIIAGPGPHEAGVSRDFNFDIYEIPGDHRRHEAEELARFCNGRAKVEILPESPPDKWWKTVRVTVDPIPQFIFSHIEWL